MAGNPLFEGTLIGAVPAWEFIEAQHLKGWHVKVNGEYVCDAETGEPTLYKPPQSITTTKELWAWLDQVKASVGRMAASFTSRLDRE